MMRNDSPVSKVSLKLMKIRKNEILRVTLYPNPVFNEMWFLTIDPFIGISVFIAKLSKRQTAGVFSRTFIVKNFPIL